MITIKHRIISSLFLFIFDIIWITFYMKNQYKILIKNITNKNLKVNFYYAISAYLLMILGLNLFALPSYSKNINIFNCLPAFLFGFILYGIYNYTCGAIFENWNFKLTIIDMLWGGFVYFISSYILKFF